MNFSQWISVALIVICFYIIWQIKQLLLLLLMSIVLGIALDILVRKLEKFGIKRIYGVLISILLLLTLLISSFWLILPSLISQFQELINLVPQGIQKLIIVVNDFRDNLSPVLNNSLPNINQIFLQLQPLINDLFGRGLSVVSGFLGTLLSSLLLLALTLMLLVNPQPYRDGFIRIFPSFYRPRCEQILLIAQKNLQEFLTDIVLEILIITILIFCGLFLLGIPLVFAQAILTGILSFIPYLGPLISVIFPVAIALIYSSWKPWLVIILYITTYQLTDKFILPKIRKNPLLLSPLIVILGEIFFAGFLGFLGLFLALPLTIISQVIVKEIIIKDILDRW